MPCPHTLLLSASLDPECTDRRRSQILGHVRSCPICAAELAVLQCLSADLRALPDPGGASDLSGAWKAPPAVFSRGRSRWKFWRDGSSWWTRLPAGLAVAASLAAGVGLADWSLPVAAPAQSLAVTARMDSFDPVPPGGLCAAAGLCGTTRGRT